MIAMLARTVEVQPALFGTSTLIEWIIKTIVPLILLFIGIGVLTKSRRGQLSENANTMVNVFIGLTIMTSAGAFFAFSKAITSMLTGGGL